MPSNYFYDANGNQITKTAEGKTETNTYDGLNQLIGFTDGETTASYAYNVDGLRYEKIVDGQRINHVWDGSKQIIADVIDNQFYEADCYIRGTNLVAKYNYRNGNKSEYTYYTQNAHGDVVNLTNADGEVTKTYKYDAFGVEKDISNSDTNAFRYCGEYYDAETGTIYLRARYYDPDIGRFISRDSFSGKQGDPLSLNRYTYCHNNPVVFVDCNGNFPFLPQLIGAGVGALISTGSKIISNVKNGNDWYDGVGKAALSGAVSGLISTIPIPGVGPLASAVITGGASNLAADAINGDINSFKDAALSFTSGAVTGAISYGISNKIYSSKALKERDKLLQGMSKNQRSKHSTVVGAYDAKLGRVNVDFSGEIPDKISGSLIKRANRIGGIGSKGLTSSNVVGCCAEFRSANTLMLKGSRINNIRFTAAVRPRTEEVIPACKNCTSIFKEAFR